MNPVMSATRYPYRFAVMLAALLLWSSIANAFEITPVTSPSGIKAWLVEDHKNPIITIQATFLGGASGDPAGKPGLANLASGLLDEGAGELDSTAFQKALADNSISLSFNSSTDLFSGTLSTLTETSEVAFRLLRLALNEPRFDAAPLERVRGQVMAGLRSRKENPNRIAGRVWWKGLFPIIPTARRAGGPSCRCQLSPARICKALPSGPSPGTNSISVSSGTFQRSAWGRSWIRFLPPCPRLPAPRRFLMSDWRSAVRR